MRSLTKRSLETKIIAVLGLVLLGLIAISSAMDLVFETRDTHNVVVRELEVLANTIQKSLIKDMRDGRGADVQEILEMVGTEKGILAVRIFDESGKIMRSSKRLEIGKDVPGQVALNYRAGKRDFISEGDGYKVFHIIHPIANAPACYGCHGKDKEINGVLALDYSLEALDYYIYHHKFRTVILLVVTVVAAGLSIFLLLSRFVTGPIKVMEAAMADAEGGNLDVNIPVSSRDEIGSLQQSFNSMLARIKALNEKTLLQQRDLVKREQELEFQHFLEEKNRALESAKNDTELKNRYYMEMLSFISHELKNPLMVLKGYSSLFLKDDLGELTTVQHEALLAMDRNVDAIQEMIANYMDLSRIERGELRLDKKALDLVEDIIRPVMQEFRETVERASMGVRIEGVEAPVKLTADPVLVKSVLGNLISNAVKYGLEGSDVIVEVGSPPGAVEISVYNEGGGIPYDGLKKVFERFTRLDNKEVRSKKGSGLGLYIVKKIVEMHGGEVRAESKEGAWARITFTLPTGPSGE